MAIRRTRKAGGAPRVVLGVCNAPDSGAALIVDGRIAAAVNEERFNRERVTDAFPAQSVEWLLKSNGLTPRDIEACGCGAWRGPDPAATVPRLEQDARRQARINPGARAVCEQRAAVSASRDAARKADLLQGMERLGFAPGQILFFDHHFAHALTAFCCSPFDSAVVLCADGRGDGRSVTLWDARADSGLRLIDLCTELDSPGAFYGMVTALLGFTPMRHEGKVTGMAALGGPSPAYEILKKGFCPDPATGGMAARIGDYYSPFMTARPPGLARELEPFSREDIAWAAQRILEETLCGFLMRRIGDRPKESVDLCLAGGCAANVKLNMELLNLRPVRNVYVFPHMGDGGNALGGALAAALPRNGSYKCELPHVYLGTEYGAAAARAALDGHKLEYRELPPEQIPEVAARQLAAGRVLGWFQGRMEYGPRALGARSILAPASDPSMPAELNRRLRRSDFMPFAPATTEELAPLCFKGWRPDHAAARFMTLCYPCTDAFKRACPAAVHADGTARPQIVPRALNPAFHETLRLYHQFTGAPAIINTSFNRHEEPIVESPDQAARALKQGWIDILLIGNIVSGL